MTTEPTDAEAIAKLRAWRTQPVRSGRERHFAIYELANTTVIVDLTECTVGEEVGRTRRGHKPSLPASANAALKAWEKMKMEAEQK